MGDSYTSIPPNEDQVDRDMTGSTDASHGPLDSGPSDTLIDSAHRIELEGAQDLWRGFTLADLAHVFMLRDADLLAEDVSTSLIGGILTLDENPPEQDSLHPETGDVYRNREKMLDDLGVETGWLGLGRPRREASTLAYQLTVRRLILNLTESVLECISAITTVSECHRDTLMPDYTYNQRAQPTVFGHYLLGFASPLLRELDRLRTAFDHVNRSPAGTGSTNGSRLDLNREIPRDHLGFEGLVEHARDAMWQADGPIELSGILASLTTSLARLAEDLQLFATQEYGFIELADEHSRASVLMPQKKNPYSLAFVRGVAGEIGGLVPSMAGAGKTTTGQVDNRQFPYHRVPESLDLVIRTTRLMTDVIKSLSVNTTTMKQAADDQLNCSTDLAEYLVVTHGVDYRRAHGIVGETVRRLGDGRGEITDFDLECLNTVLDEYLDDDIRLTEEELEAVVDVENVVQSRRTPGGASRERLNELIESMRTSHADHREWFETTRQSIDTAEESLLSSARSLSEDDSP
ncbi:MAG: argininosuccinate lyase [bacterium]